MLLPELPSKYEGNAHGSEKEGGDTRRLDETR